MRRLALSFVCAVSVAGAAFAEGCSFTEGTSAPEIEALNQMILDRSFTKLAQQLEPWVKEDISEGFEPVAQAYASGFDRCKTIVQRRDVGGMMQELVLFESDVGPLFVYWVYVGTGAEFRFLHFRISSTTDILEMLR